MCPLLRAKCRCPPSLGGLSSFSAELSSTSYKFYCYFWSQSSAVPSPHQNTKVQLWTRCAVRHGQPRVAAAARKTGRLQGQGAWLGYPLPAPRQALPKPGGGSDCHTVFGDQLQEMTQGPSVLPNNSTLLGLPGCPC